jgi:hypothetical protein
VSYLRVVPTDEGPTCGNDELVAWLQSYVARAKAGEFRSVALALVTADGGVASAWLAVDKSSVDQLAAVTLLQHRLTVWINEDDE